VVSAGYLRLERLPISSQIASVNLRRAAPPARGRAGGSRASRERLPSQRTRLCELVEAPALNPVVCKGAAGIGDAAGDDACVVATPNESIAGDRLCCGLAADVHPGTVRVEFCTGRRESHRPEVIHTLRRARRLANPLCRVEVPMPARRRSTGAPVDDSIGELRRAHHAQSERKTRPWDCKRSPGGTPAGSRA
jgi:hypothetical protein